jgi:hypothetical protein
LHGGRKSYRGRFVTRWQRIATWMAVNKLRLFTRDFISFVFEEADCAYTMHNSHFDRMPLATRNCKSDEKFRSTLRVAGLLAFVLKLPAAELNLPRHFVFILFKE